MPGAQGQCLVCLVDDPSLIMLLACRARDGIGFYLLQV